MEEQKKQFTITDFAKQMVDGFEDCNDREIIIYHGKDGKMRGLVEWVIRCLANPKCENTQEVLRHIQEKRMFI